MAIKREGAALRLGDQAGDSNAPCVSRCAFCEPHGAGRAVVIERLTQQMRVVKTDAESVDVIWR